MRQARAGDWSRRLRERKADWSTSIARLSLAGVPSLGTIEVPFFSPVTVLAGANGAGKTTLLRAIWAALDAERASAVIIPEKKLTSGTANLGLSINGTAAEAEVQFSIDKVEWTKPVEVSVIHIDGSIASSWDQSYFCSFENAADITNGLGSLTLDPSMLAEVNYILHRDYNSIIVYEVDGDSNTIPFFEVSYGNDRYDSRTMGSGEISALYIWWALNRASNSSIILIEEPEAFLSAASQRTLSNHLVALAMKKQLCVVISSHSPYLISSLPRDCVHFLSRGQNGLHLVSDQPPPVLLANLGIEPAITSIVFVEDAMGLELVRAVLEKNDPALSRRIHIEVRNGEGEITRALRVTQTISGPIRFIGAYDGDQRNSLVPDVQEHSLFLPGTEPIEKIFKDMVVRNPQALGKALGGRNIDAIIDGLEGANIHDWYEGVSKEVGLTKPQLFPILLRIWLDADDNAKAFATTYEELCDVLTKGRPDIT